MTLPNEPANPTRKDLAEVFESPRLLRAFEQVFDLIPSGIDESGLTASSALTLAQHTLALIERVAAALELLALAPSDLPDVGVDDLAPPLISVGQDDLIPSGSVPLTNDDLSPSIKQSHRSDLDFYVRENLILSKVSGNGIKVDTVLPTFPWHDIIGNLEIKVAGANDPTLAVYRTNGGNTVSDFMFSNLLMNEFYLNYHIPHDYVPGSDLHIHVHWSQITVDTGGAAAVPGIANWNFDFTYAKGHGAAGGAADPFNAPLTTAVTQQGSTTQYGHMLAEVQITNTGGDASHLDNAEIEPDGVLIVRMWRDPTDGIDTLDQEPFVHFVDVHYQSTNIGTKQKAPDFYT